MFRPTIGGSAAAGGRQSTTATSAATSSGSTASQNKQQAPQPPSSNDNVPSTIREIRSRTTSTTTSSSASNNARQLLANRRQAMSMERLNSNNGSTNTNGGSNSSSATSTTHSSSMHNINSLSDKEKSSPINGSSNSINGSAASSPSRNSSTSSTAGLNRTASRVSRFRIAKAVFERLSSADSVSDKPNRPTIGERPKGTVASRYAAAAAARGIAAQQANSNSSSNNNSVTSPRSRMTSTTANKSLTRSQQLENKTASRSTAAMNSSTSTNKSLASGRHDAQPRPQPRVIATTRKSPTSTSQQQDNSAQMQNNTIKSRTGSAPTVSTANGAKQTQPLTSSATVAATSKPPPKDLIDKIVLEIARDADKEHDANCTIQDLSNCDISGIPETLDFDKCFQDVEMMTEEEARKLLSRKSDSSSSLSTSGGGGDQKSMPDSTNESENVSADIIMRSNNHNVTFRASVNQNSDHEEESTLNQSAKSSDSLVPSSISSNVTKARVRFSNEPVTVFDTHAIEDYDRRNDDIDPVAASAEYEIEKSRERDGIKLAGDDDDDNDDDDGDVKDGHNEKDNEQNEDLKDDKSGAVILSERFTTHTSTTQPMTTAKPSYEVKNLGGGGDGGDRVDDGDFGSQRQVAAAAPHIHPGGTIDGSQHQHQFAHHPARQDIGLTNFSETAGNQRLSGASATADDEDKARAQKEYIEFLEREVSLKQILEQNLRDLQSQYYETVKQLDGYKGSAEIKLAKFEQQLADANNRLESAQNELSDAREQSGRFEKQLNDNKESSQLLEKKYHRAKRIIKDLQSREESFTKRELLYQQKLDEIEFELKELISSIDRTIYDDALKYFSISDSSHCLRQHQTRLDAFGLIRQMLSNFNSSKTSQSAQIKQRIATMLEQQLAHMLAQSNNGTSVTAGPIIPIPPALPIGGGGGGTGTNLSSDNNNLPLSSVNTNNNNDSKRHNQNNHHNYASHRLSQPNMPHPIGVGGQPTKLFHGLGPIPIPATNEPSPPQSVNSYPSSNSLNSLNMNNNNQQTVNNNIAGNNKFRDLNLPPLGDSHKTLPTSSATDDAHQHHQAAFQPTAADTQAPYSTNEWHDKPVSEWTTNQVSTWLLALGLDQYISKFEDRNVNGQSLINLDSTVLKGLGVLNSNDRNLLKKKIRELRVEMEKERKIIEKKLKENLKSKTSASQPGGGLGGGSSGGGSASKQSWKKSLLS